MNNNNLQLQSRRSPQITPDRGYYRADRAVANWVNCSTPISHPGAPKKSKLGISPLSISPVRSPASIEKNKKVSLKKKPPVYNNNNWKQSLEVFGVDEEEEHAANIDGASPKEESSSSVSTINICPLKGRYSCRDETKEQGDVPLPDEENVKGAILKYIEETYSNRDILHIQEELRVLRSERKYPAMNRLASFTTGFLQDVFLGVHLDKQKD